eukprot:9622683-Ditylum_brightwellii.AAC.1
MTFVNCACSPPSIMALIPTKSHSHQHQTCMLKSYYATHLSLDPDPSSLIPVTWNALAIHYSAMSPLQC